MKLIILIIDDTSLTNDMGADRSRCDSSVGLGDWSFVWTVMTYRGMGAGQQLPSSDTMSMFPHPTITSPNTSSTPITNLTLTTSRFRYSSMTPSGLS